MSWRELSHTAVEYEVDAATLASFAEMVWAFIDELSASSASGHSDELAKSARVRRQQLDRLSHLLLTGAAADAVLAAAVAADWDPPERMTALVVPANQVREVLAVVDPRSLQPETDLDLAEAGEVTVLLLPDPDRSALLGALTARDGVVVGPDAAWLDVRHSLDRATRALRLHPGEAGVLDTEAVLAELVAHADPRALADLRQRALAPLQGIRPDTAERLEETLRAWLLLQGRREEVAKLLFVHPQTVRYRMGKVRELWGEAQVDLNDPDVVRDLVVALA